MTRAIWSATALADFDEIDTFYREREPAVARRVGDLAVAAGRHLAVNPRLGPIVEGNLRKSRVRSTPCIILHREIDEGVDIARLIHARRNWRPRP